MPQPPAQNLSSYLQENQMTATQRSLFSSVASGLWSVVTLGYGSPASTASNPAPKPSNDNNAPIITYLPSLPSEGSNSNGNGADIQIDCANRYINQNL